MLKKFFEEWNAALKNETIKKTQYDDNNNILWQTGEVTFRDTVIQIHRKSNGDGGYTAELFVPSTNKFINNQRFPSKAKCAEAILIALIPGNEKEAIRRTRIEKKAGILYNGVYLFSPSFPFLKVIIRNSLYSSRGTKNFHFLVKKVLYMFCRYVRTHYFCTRFRR